MKKIVALLLSLCLGLGAASAMAAGEKIALITMDSIDQHWITPVSYTHLPALQRFRRGAGLL